MVAAANFWTWFCATAFTWVREALRTRAAQPGVAQPRCGTLSRAARAYRLTAALAWGRVAITLVEERADAIAAGVPSGGY